jgi:hypothetical protein
MENKWPVAGYGVAPGRSIGVAGNAANAGIAWRAAGVCFAGEKENAVIDAV